MENLVQSLPMIIILGVMIIFFVFSSRKSKKEQQAIDDMRNNLQIGDEVTTIGGIIGRVVSIKDETCVIETSRNCTRIRILKSAVKTVDVPVEATKAAEKTETKETKK